MSVPRFELHHDAMEETYTIRRVEDIGPFGSREDARQYMLDLKDEQKKRLPPADSNREDKARRTT